uniref:Desmocollin 1 n=1 Tax=Fundulus heteroclitus TaxID=8078 RepID=A0A3Q2PL94_FUNHE
MTKILYPVYLLLILSCVESCSIPGSLYVLSPQTIPAGYHLTKVEAVGCDPDTLHLTVEDPSFTVQSNGVVVALSPVSVATSGRTFSVRAQDGSGPASEMEVHLVCGTKQKTNEKGQAILKRTKRRWSPPPINILENDVGPFPKDVERIASNSEAKYDVYYTIEGPGVNQYPLNIFSLDKETGVLKVHQPLDREEFPKFILIINALDKVTNQPKDEPLDLTVSVDDKNDNKPEFSGPLIFSVLEQTTNLVVGKVEATDKDDPETDHVKIKFTLKDGLEYFAINPDTGVITTVSNKLDRETKDKHMVTIEIRDLKGAPNGLFNTATATITLLDINDNPPTFRQPSFKATIPENKGETLILRIPVDDKDLKNSDNWISKFVITKGNETGNFRIETDPTTNEGLLYVTKPLDYEKNSKVNLEISAQNKAKLNGTTASWLTVPVEVDVTDIDEGPEFLPASVTYTIKENLPNGTVIGTYKAVDPESRNSNGITYRKQTDPGSWVGVDQATGELTVTNTIDRESPLVKDGMYIITVRATDSSFKTGTGTVTLVILDENDNIPLIPERLIMCEEGDKLTSKYIFPEDNDNSPYSAPFSFAISEEYVDTWNIMAINGTTGLLEQKKKLPTGIHDVSFFVGDQQGIGKKQTTEVRICQCVNGKCIDKDRSVSLGPMGILALLLPLFLLLLLGLLLFFVCTTKREKIPLDDMGYSAGILLPSNTEAPGDEVDATHIFKPDYGYEQGVKSSIKGSTMNMGLLGQKSTSTIGGHSVHDNGFQQSSVFNTLNMQNRSSSQFEKYSLHNGSRVFGNGAEYGSGLHASELTSYQTWRTHGLCLNETLNNLQRSEEDPRDGDDVLHRYGYEGVGSPVGSVGCCSEHPFDENLDFLNSIQPKFKTLAEVCTKR